MKKLLYFFFMTALPSMLSAQVLYEKFITFESNGQYAVIDGSQPDNIWQKGTPSKIYFDSAFSVPYAIVTDTLNPYPSGNLSSFEVKFISPGTCWGTAMLAFEHKYKTDTLRAGGYLEVAYDSSTHFINIIDDTVEPQVGFTTYNFYTQQDTIEGGIPAFNGLSGGWVYSTVFWIWEMGVKSPMHDSLTVRFNFKSSANASPDEGWMIDDIILHLEECTGGIEEITKMAPQLRITPNPVMDQSIANIISGGPGKYTFTVFDPMGKQVRGEIVSYPAFLIKKGNLSPGLYLYRLTGESGTGSSGTFVIR